MLISALHANACTAALPGCAPITSTSAGEIPAAIATYRLLSSIAQLATTRSVSSASTPAPVRVASRRCSISFPHVMPQLGLQRSGHGASSLCLIRQQHIFARPLASRSRRVRSRTRSRRTRQRCHHGHHYHGRPVLGDMCYSRLLGRHRSCHGLARSRELRPRVVANLSRRGLDAGTLVFVARLMRAAWRTCHTEPQQLAIGGSDLVVPAPWPRVYRRGGGEVRLRCGGLSGGGELGSGCGALGGGHGGEFGGGGGGIGGGVGGLGIGLVFHCGRLAAARGLPVCARHGSWHQRLSTRLAAA
mmetsp:Transcript_24219/g.55979  ORF Transcript_24219/g.55979 Transcript_24219/m.55979 type:complete len:302 (+) Transcript_24219:62-967(+)